MNRAPGEVARNEPAAVGAVLAGGASSRLGGAKATVELAGRPLISYPLTAVEEAGLEPIVVAKGDSPLPPLVYRVLYEPVRPRHPLCGIVAALRDAGGRPVVAVGCDMPLIVPAVLAWLAAAEEPLIVPEVGGRAQPLLARYGAELLAPLERALASRMSLQRAIRGLGPRRIGEEELARFGDPESICFNVNTAADLERARTLLGLAAG